MPWHYSCWGLAFQGQIQAANLFQSPLPPPDTPCFVQTLDGFTLEVYGYVDNSDGTTTLTYRVTNANKKDISYVAFGTAGWTPFAPSDGITTTLGLGEYHVEWTNDHGNPGFASIKYETQFNGFSKGAQDTFALTVGNFDPAASIQVQMKAGKDRTTFILVLNDFTCDRTPTPTPTATPVSPLPTPVHPVVPTVAYPDTEVYVLDATMFLTELGTAEKEQRWQLGLPVPLVTAPDDEHVIADDSITSHPNGHGKAGLLALAPQAVSQAVDNWSEEDREDFESEFPNTVDDCIWQRTQRASGGQHYIWDRANDRKVSGTTSLWPAGAVNADAPPGTQPLPVDSTYPTEMITSVICKLPGANDAENVLAEFQMLYELADSGDSLSVQFFSGTDDGNGVTLNYKGGLEWRGSASGLVSHEWREYHIYYPDLLSDDDTIWVKWRFSSDGNNNPAKGPWLDDVAVSTYQKPQSSVNCQTADPVYSSDRSKGLNIGPYTEDLKFRDPVKFSEMVNRLATSGVNWVRMEFSVNPSYFTLANTAKDPVDPLTVLDGYNHIDLRQYDLFVDSICALNSDSNPTNDIAILGLIDNTTLVRHDWYRETGDGIVVSNGYLLDFVDVAEQLAGYFDDRIGAWEVWNEPDNDISGLLPNQYAILLNETNRALKAVDGDDHVLFTGLVGANGSAQTYFNTALSSLLSPKPFDLFALHPYFTEEYPGRNGELAELDPAYYMRADIEARPQTIVKKFRDDLDDDSKFLPEEQGKPIWATEVGWNSAKGTMQCSNLLQLVVNEEEQACYLQRGFHSLFNLSPTVDKVFWYTYHDTGPPISEEDCGEIIAIPSTLEQVPSPSWYNSAVGHYFARVNSDSTIIIPWSFGLYRGNIHRDVDDEGKPITEADKAKPVQAAFQNWPSADINCLEPWPTLPTIADLDQKVYLPLVSHTIPAASGQ